MESESESDDEKEFDQSTGKKLNYTGHQEYCLVKEWVIGEDSVLEEAKTQHEV
jgi:hypothetical protein